MNGCTCEACKAMCKRPCWPTPKEARALIAAGYGKRLMRDEWVADPSIELLCPANPGHEGLVAPFNAKQGCTFQTKTGLCQLHRKGLKPREGRLAMCNKKGGTPKGLHERMKKTWENAGGRKLVREWNAQFLREEDCGPNQPGMFDFFSLFGA